MLYQAKVNQLICPDSYKKFFYTPTVKTVGDSALYAACHKMWMFLSADLKL